MAERLSVLLIEDDIHDVDAVRRAFGTVFPPVFDLSHAPRFLDAIKLIKTKHFHVVILDLGLPDSVGLNGVERLMSLLPTVPVIVLTGLEDEESALAGIALGAQEFLSKDAITPRHLIRTIRHAIKRKQHSLSQKPSEANGADVKELERLASIIRETSSVVKDRVGTLMETDLTDEQLALVNDIKQSTIESSMAINDTSTANVVVDEKLYG